MPEYFLATYTTTGKKRFQHVRATLQSSVCNTVGVVQLFSNYCICIIGLFARILELPLEQHINHMHLLVTFINKTDDLYDIVKTLFSGHINLQRLS